MRKENKLKQAFKDLWFFRLWKILTGKKGLCPRCRKNPADKENPNSWCFDCYFKSLYKVTYRQKKNKVKGGKKKMTENKDKTASTENKTFEATCMKCKKQVIVQEPQIVQMKGKGNSTRDCVKGLCPDCKVGVFRILKKQ